MATCPSGLRELIANQRFMGSNPIVASKKAPLIAGFSFAPLGVFLHYFAAFFLLFLPADLPFDLVVLRVS